MIYSLQDGYLQELYYVNGRMSDTNLQISCKSRVLYVVMFSPLLR